MIKHINLQRFAEGDTNPDEKKEQDIEKKQEPAKEGFSIRKAFGLPDKKEPEKKEPAKEPKPADKPDEKPAEKKDEVKKEPEKEPEFDEILYNKEKVKIPVTERQTYLQKGYNYDKVKTDADAAKATLKRIAQAEGFDTVDKYLAELDKREKAKLAEQIEEAVGDPDKINEIVENHPVVKQTKEEKRKLDYVNIKTELSKSEFFKKLEPKLDELMEQNPTADPKLVYPLIVGQYVMSDEYKQEQAAKDAQTAKDKEEAKAAAEKKVINDAHDKERRSTPKGGDADANAPELARPTAVMSEIARAFGVNANKVAQKIANQKNKK